MSSQPPVARAKGQDKADKARQLLRLLKCNLVNAYYSSSGHLEEYCNYTRAAPISNLTIRHCNRILESTPVTSWLNLQTKKIVWIKRSSNFTENPAWLSHNAARVIDDA
jgi:hypothetical protein